MAGTDDRGGGAQLARTVGLGGAVVLGLGSILGTGAFVALGLGAGAAGAWLPVAVVAAGLLAACNGLSSAQLAAKLPSSGGTYLYAQRLLNPMAGTMAGATFLVAKSCSAATAALGAVSYAVRLATGEPASGLVVTVGAAAVVVATAALVVGGLRRSNAVNAGLVAVTLAGLGVFVWAAYGWGAGVIGGAGGTRQAASLNGNGVEMGIGVLEAAALCFVAYTGYGRVATLGEEIKHPRRNIPVAVVATLAVSAAAYLLVTLAALYAVGPAGFAVAAEGGATLENVLHMSGAPGWARGAVAVAAVAAMLGVLLNLVLGLSRVALAMGRGGELPKAFAKLDKSGKTPLVAVMGVAVVILLAVATGSIAAAWSFSAVTVLIYYGLTNAAALRLAAKDRIAPKWVSWAGLIGCVGLAAFVEGPYLIAAMLLLGAAAAWHTIARLMQ